KSPTFEGIAPLIWDVLSAPPQSLSEALPFLPEQTPPHPSSLTSLHPLYSQPRASSLSHWRGFRSPKPLVLGLAHFGARSFPSRCLPPSRVLPPGGFSAQLALRRIASRFPQV